MSANTIKKDDKSEKPENRNKVGIDKSAAEIKEKINVGVVGLGGRGSGMLNLVLSFSNVDVLAVCDLYEDRAQAGANKVLKKRGIEPLCTIDYKEMLSMNLDAILIFSSWEDHIKIAIDAMKAGMYVGMEVGGAYSIEDCWNMVNTSEETGMPCMLLENCCYGEYELAILKAVRENLFGEIVYCSGGYLHDLRREITFGKENRHYRLRNYLNRNCENYPTHELGPIAKVLNINRGNRMISLTSFATKARGLHEYILNHKADDEELVKAEFKQGDIVTTVIECANGENIVLTLDTTLPRPYSRGFTVRGTKGFYQEDGNIIYFDSKWHKSLKSYYNKGRKFVKKHPHPIWKHSRKKTDKRFHGGMDWIVLSAFFESIKLGENTPINVYDTASWMAVTALSEISIRENNRKVEFPDFTKGKWNDPPEKLRNFYALD